MEMVDTKMATAAKVPARTRTSTGSWEPEPEAVMEDELVEQACTATARVSME
jgi:hypothetical protein